MVDKEERDLKKKLDQLEKKYKDTLFEDLKHPIVDDLPEEGQVNESLNKKIIFKDEELTRKIPKFESPVFEKSDFQKSTTYKPHILLKDSINDPKNPLNLKKEVLKSKNENLPLKKENLKPKKEILQSKKKTSNESDLSGSLNHLEIKKSSEKITRLRNEISKALVGQDEIVSGLIMGLLCNAHVLVEGVPGIAKTLAIRSLAAASGCSVKRIQFTVDMLPTDITGIVNYTPEKGFEIIKGPIFANFLIADEINRAPPKTQSALIEGMQEKQVTIGRKRFILPDPFFVMATENPIENSGVYPLPEAQIDRFLFKLIMGYPKSEEEKKIMGSNITIEKFEHFNIIPVITPKEIIELQELVKKVYLDDNIRNYILEIVRKTREKDFENAQYISYGCSPRASIALFIASKANALMNGRDYVLPEDIKKVAPLVMRHRLILSYKASIQKISPDLIIKEILDSVAAD